MEDTDRVAPAAPTPAPAPAEQVQTAAAPPVAEVLEKVDALGPPLDNRTVIMRGAPCTELTVRFQFLYLKAEELSRFLVSFERLYNSVARVLRRLESVYDLPADDRLRVSRIVLEMDAAITFRGAICRVEGEPARDIGVLDLIRELFAKVPLDSTEESFKNLVHIREHKAGTAVQYDSNSVPVNKEKALEESTGKLETLRVSLIETARALLPGAPDEEVCEVADIAFQIPGEIFQRRNLWGLELG
jgi:hypothetical protein